MVKNPESIESPRYTNFQQITLVTLRILIGWHFLYEGMVKIVNPEWSAEMYLKDSKGLFSGIFNWLAANQDFLSVVNQLNMWGLLLIGLALILGLYTRYFCYAGVCLLALYYLAAPPFLGYTYIMPLEGSYLLVNKNLIELVALLVLIAFPSSHIIGLDRLLINKGIKSNS